MHAIVEEGNDSCTAVGRRWGSFFGVGGKIGWLGMDRIKTEGMEEE